MEGKTIDSGSFKADKVSGIEGSIFATSVILEVALQSNIQNIFKFPFYGLSFDDKAQKLDEWIDERLYTKEVENILNYVSKNGSSYFEKIKNSMIKESNEMFDLSRSLTPKLKDFSDYDLVHEYTKFMHKYAYSFGVGAVTFIYEDIMSRRLTESISKRFQNPTDTIGSLLSSLYKSFMNEAEDLLVEIKEEADEAKRKTLIEKYKENFFFMRSNFSFSTILDDDEVAKLAEAVERHTPDENSPIIVEQEDLLKEEKLTVAVLKETVVIHDMRKRANYIGNFTIFRFLEEVCKRKGIDITIARRMFWNEFADLVLDTEKLVMRLNERTNASIVLTKEGSYYLDYVALESREILDDSVTECSGTPACKGKITANARIVLTTADFSKFKQGDVLIAEGTRPEYVPIMKQASAIVTDEGGLTCHAAIVSRELNTPCIVGTKIATRIIKDGDLVEVDADNGVVRIIK